MLPRPITETRLVAFGGAFEPVIIVLPLIAEAQFTIPCGP